MNHEGQNTTTPPTLLEASQLSVTLGGHKVLDVPSLEVFPNEVLAIIGPNGSGKTTLLLALALLLKPATGAIYYKGQPVRNGAEILRLRRRFAVVLQEPLLLNATVWDNVTLGLRLRGAGKSEIKARTQQWLERFGITSLARRQAKTLSGGEAKRVSLARAFVLQPEVIFLDEPFTTLDSPTRQTLIEDFGNVLQETRISTVMVTHDRNEALILASRVAVLIDGSIRQIGSPQEVFSTPADDRIATFVEAGNILPGVVTAQKGGIASLKVGDYQLEAVSDLPTGTRVTLYLHYEDITVLAPSSATTPTSARNHLRGKVFRVFPLGSQVRVTIDCGFPLVALITRRSWEDLELAVDQEVATSFKASSIHLIPRL